MLEPQLFLGIEFDEKLRKGLLYANPHAVEIFINSSPEYLQEVEHEGKRYLGKECGKHQLIEALQLVQNNAESLIQKLIPDYEKRPFLLFSTAVASNS